MHARCGAMLANVLLASDRIGRELLTAEAKKREAEIARRIAATGLARQKTRPS
jgi:hypothetical protein